MSNLFHVAIGILFGWLWFSDCSAQQQIVLADWPPPELVFANSYTGGGIPFGQAVTIDASHIAPAEAVGVSLSGMLIITKGTMQETCDLVVYFRPSPDHKWGAYRGQTIEATPGGGQRSNHAITIPMVDRKFQVWIDPAGRPRWPTGCAYGVNYRPDYWIVQHEGEP